MDDSLKRQPFTIDLNLMIDIRNNQSEVRMCRDVCQIMWHMANIQAGSVTDVPHTYLDKEY